MAVTEPDDVPLPVRPHGCLIASPSQRATDRNIDHEYVAAAAVHAFSKRWGKPEIVLMGGPVIVRRAHIEDFPRMARPAADYMAEALAQAGVKRIYGVVGDSLNGFTDALRRLKSIDWIHVRHEEGAAFSAAAEAHLTGELAVCAGSCGPGNLHLINGLYDAHRSQVPVLAIAAHIPTSEIGIDYFQATHPELLFKECSHYAELVTSPDQLPQILDCGQCAWPSRRKAWLSSSFRATWP